MSTICRHRWPENDALTAEDGPENEWYGRVNMNATAIGVRCVFVTDSDLIARYDRSAASYQRWWAPVIAPAALRVLDLVDEAVALTADPLIVDVGAGTGTLARGAVLRWPEARVIAFDPSEGMLDMGRAVARRTLPADGTRRLQWERATADRLQLDDGTADAVVSSFALQHLPSRIAGLREAHRVLRAAVCSGW